MLDPHALNRALLARQGLLERSRTPAPEMVERLVAMQAQVPSNPYVALWSRLEEFDPLELSAAIEERRAARFGTLRSTLHLATARDCRTLEPLTRPVLRQVFQTNFGRYLGSAPLDEVLAAGRELLAAEPRTRAELSRALAPRFPDAREDALAYAVTFGTAIVQVTPRGLWRRSSQARWALMEDWIGAPDATGSIDELVLRYLGAFGPATVADARTWSRLTGLREVFERLRPQLVTLADERGRELFDLPDAPRPDPATPAPPRFLPEYDNVWLSHEDRARITGEHPPWAPLPTGQWVGSLLVDGFVRAFWEIVDGELRVHGFLPQPDDPPGTAEAIAEEGERLVAFVTTG